MSVVVQTAMGMADPQRAPWLTPAGGQAGVVDFQVPALADVTMEWAQVGNHDFALYDNKNSLLACDAGTRFACVPSAAAATGTHVFPKLQPGRYHMVVDADAPGKEGGVVLQFSAAAAAP